MFTPSSKQDVAIMNMEKVLGFEEYQHETNFETKEKFQTYFKELQEKVEEKIKKDKKRKNFKNAINLWKISYEEVNKQKNEKLLKYYSNEKTLLEKAKEYQSKWGNSKWKVKKWMMKKTWNNVELVNKVIENIEIDENFMIQCFFENGMQIWKSLDFLKNKAIFTKLFDKDLVEKYLEKYKKVEIDETIIKQLIEKYQRKKKNKYEIKSLLYPMFKYQVSSIQLIEEFISKYYLEEKEEDNLTKEYKKLLDRGIEKQKIINQLMRKWYNYWKIKKLF